MNSSTNPSAIYSRDMLADSLIQLLNNYTFDKLTISQIVENAHLSRRTYYRHFNSKDEIIRYTILRMLQQYEKKILTYKQLTFEVFFRTFFEICTLHKDFLLNLTHNNLIHILLEECLHTLPQLYAQVAHKIIDFPLSLEPQLLDFLITFNTGGALCIAFNWFNNGMVNPIDELCHLLRTYKNLH